MYVDIMAPTELSASSSSPTDRGTSTNRPTGSSGSSTASKSFSTVLQTVRGNQGRNDSRESKVVRTAEKADERSSPKQTKGLQEAPSRVKRSDGSSNQIVNDNEVKEGEGRDAQNSQGEPEFSVQASQAVSGSADQNPTTLEPMMVAQVAVSSGAQAGLDSKEGSHCTNCGDESDEDPGRPYVASKLTATSVATVVHTTQAHTSENNRTTPVKEGQVHTQETPVIRSGVELPVAQQIKPDTSIVDGNSDEPVVEQVETRPVAPESKPAPIPLPQNLGVPHTDRMDLGMISSDDQSLPTKDVAIQSKHTSLPALPYDQAQQYTQSSEAHADLSAKPQILFGQGQQLNGATTESSKEWWTEQQAQQQGNHETQSYKTSANNFQPINSQVVEPFVNVGPGQTLSASGTHTHGSLTIPTHPSLPTAELTPHSIGSMIRSVVVDVVQPELGHVNVRISMMNDSVHAHFSTDRVEVGQFLMNGQDRLQTTLQASGLDIGQFRVDIDRQSGGRSFQQGAFQEQGQAWNQGSHGHGKEQAQGWSDDTRSLLQGRLNLVA